jgi:hypothetical protein
MVMAALVRRGCLVSKPFGENYRYDVITDDGQNGKVYLVPESELVATKGHLRVAPCLNRQARKIRWAAEYELA